MESEEVDWQPLLAFSAGVAAAQDSGEERGEELHRLTAGDEDNELLISLGLTKTGREGFKKIITATKNKKYMQHIYTWTATYFYH